MVFELLAVSCTALFAGAATYVTFVEHPARRACGPTVALAQWRPSYRRATIMQASLAVFGFLSACAAFIQGRGVAVLIGGVCLGVVVPVTLYVIFPTNRQLEDPARDPGAAETAALLARWGRLHAIRTALSLAALGILVVHAVARP